MKRAIIFFFSFVSLLSAEIARAQLQMPTLDNSDVIPLINSTFPDATQMLDVAKCESGAREYRTDGTVLRGGSGGNYIGIFQIAESHATDAKSRGFDIYTVSGNVGYARYMYDQQGTWPWLACAPKTPAAAATPVPATDINLTSATTSTSSTQSITPQPQPVPTSTPTPMLNGTLTINMQLNIIDPQVKILQQILNSIGYPLTATGPGSPGNETTKFGLLTREAVKKFQCAKINICSGSESTNGYGRVGPMTRAALNQNPS